MAEFKSVKFAVRSRGLLDEFYVRIFLVNGIWYDRKFAFNYDQKDEMELLRNILNAPYVAVQYLQSENKRFQEVSEAIVRGNEVSKMDYEEFINTKLSPINYSKWEL